jgi:O-antigen/teichoic acid export membrane protein
MGGYSVPMLMQRCLSILLLPVYTHYVRPADYAVLDLLDLFGNIVGALVGLRLGQGLFYFYFHAKDETDRSRFVNTALLGSIAVGLLALAVVYPAAPLFSSIVLGTQHYTHFFRIFIFGFSASLPVEYGFCYLRVRDRAAAYSTIATARLIASLIFNLTFLVFFHLGAASMLWSNLIANLALTLLLTWIIVRENSGGVGRHHLVELVRYSWPLGISSLGELGLHFGDRIFLRPNVSLSLLGIYGLAYKIGMLVSYLSGPFFTYWNAQMVGIVRNPGGERLYARTATYLLLGLGYAALLVTVFAHPALTLAAAPDYRSAATFIPWIGLAYVIRGMGSYFLNTFLLDKRSSTVARITWIGTGCCMAGYAALIPTYKLWGAIAATIAGFSVIFVVGLWKSQQVRPFPYEYGRWMKIAASVVLVVVVFEMLRPGTFWLQVAFGSAASLLFPAVLFATGFLSHDERQGLHHLAQKLKVGRLR